jgi:hypothetical protein
VTEHGYPKLATGAPDFPALECEVLDYWAGDDTFTVPLFERTVDIFLAVGHISARPAFEDVAAAAPAT